MYIFPDELKGKSHLYLCSFKNCGVQLAKTQRIKPWKEIYRFRKVNAGIQMDQKQFNMSNALKFDSPHTHIGLVIA